MKLTGSSTILLNDFREIIIGFNSFHKNDSTVYIYDRQYGIIFKVGCFSKLENNSG